MQDLEVNINFDSLREDEISNFIKEKLFFHDESNLNMRNFVHFFGSEKLSAHLEFAQQ